MKRYYVDILQIAAGTVVGTALVVGYLWSMLGGMFLIFPFWVLVGLFVLFWASIVLVGLKAGYKGIVAVMASFLLGWFGFNALHQQVCGPNAEDVKVMKPMAEKISAYIVKHGIPEKLEEIPDLPYRLEGCEKSEEYLSSYNGRMRQSTKNEAELYNYKENCHFKNIELFYWLQKNLHEKSQIGITIKMISSNRTVLIRGMATDKNHQFINLDTTIGSYKNTGICNPMRQ